MTLSRRQFLAGAPAAGPALALPRAPSGVRREVFLRSPGKGTAVMAYAYYTRRRGGDMMSIEQRWTRSDTVDVSYYRYSSNHGRTWSPLVRRPTGERRPQGMWRKHPRGGWIDPATGRFLEFWLEGILPYGCSVRFSSVPASTAVAADAAVEIETRFAGCLRHRGHGSLRGEQASRCYES